MIMVWFSQFTKMHYRTDEQSISSNTAVANQTGANLDLIKQCIDPTTFPPDPEFNSSTGYPNPFVTLASV